MIRPGQVEGVEETPPIPRRSLIIDGKCFLGNGPNDGKQANCHTCPVKILTKPQLGNVTYDLTKKYLVRCDPTVAADANRKRNLPIPSPITEIPVKQPKPQEPNHIQEKFEENLINYVVKGLFPLRNINEDFHKIFTDLNCEIKPEPISYKQLVTRINKLFFKNETKVRISLKDAKFLCIVVNVWSAEFIKYICCTAHWIDETTLERKNVLVGFKKFNDDPTYKDINDIIMQVKSGLLTGQKVMRTLVSKSNHTTCLTSTIESLGERDELRLDLSNANMCASYALSILASEAFKHHTPSFHSSAFSKCHRLWCLNRRPLVGKEIQKHFNTVLKSPHPKQWHSLYDAVSQLVDLHAASKIRFNRIFIQLRLSVLKRIEIRYLNDYVQLMKPIATGLEMLQENEHWFYGMLLPTLISIQTKLYNAKNALQMSGLNAIFEQLKLKFEQFFPQLDLKSDIAMESIIATCLHPAFKLRWLPNTVDINAIIKLVRSVVKTTQAPFPSQVGLTSPENSFFYLKNEEYDEDVDELDKYFKISTIPPESTVENIQNALKNFPNVRNAFIRYNTSLCSSAALVKSFSPDNLGLRQGHLHDNYLERLVILKLSM